MNRDENYVIFVQDSSAVEMLEGLGSKSLDSAVKAINRVADSSRTLASRNIREQVNFKASDLGPNSGKLFVASRATKDVPEARIVARSRPTMLSNFVTRGRVNKPGVTVQVKRGTSRTMKRAFLIRLPGIEGSADAQRGNLAVAVRLRPGETLRNKKTSSRVKGNLHILYAPSIAQLFQSVREDITPEIEAKLEAEYFRLMELDR